MSIQQYDVWIVAIPYGASRDRRPCIVLDPPAESRVAVAPLSSAMGLYNSMLHFRIPDDDPDFVASGLRKTCFANGTEIHRVGASALLKRVGNLQGELLRKFRDWIG